MATFEYVKIGDGVTQFTNLPYVAGYPGSTGPIGPTGTQGSAGSIGGLTLELDYASISTYSSSPLAGNLLTTFNTGTLTSITVPAAQALANVATFTILIANLPGVVASSDFWDLNLYAYVQTASSPASQLS